MPMATCPGAPDAGNPHVRCDGGGATGLWTGPRYPTVTFLVLSEAMGRGRAYASGSLASGSYGGRRLIRSPRRTPLRPVIPCKSSVLLAFQRSRTHLIPLGATLVPDDVAPTQIDGLPPELDADWAARVASDALVHTECQGYGLPASRSGWSG